MAKRRGTIWSNVRWIHPKRSGYGTGVKSLREKLRYLQYRDDRNTPAPTGERRWVDCGLGGTHHAILKNCQQLASDDRLAWTLVISPKPRLLLLIDDEDKRRQLLAELTEQVMEDWFEARGLHDPQFAYVMHDRSTSEDGLSQLHSHIVLPGTAESAAGRERFDNRKSDLRQFNTIVEDQFEMHMDRYLGRSWRDRWQQIQREEALRKQLKQLEIEPKPDDLPNLSERLYRVGLDVDQIPVNLTDAAQFEQWLSGFESDEPDLDVWFGERDR
jgi:hypothetical protein